MNSLTTVSTLTAANTLTTENGVTNVQGLLASNTATGLGELFFLHDLALSLDVFAAILSVMLLVKIVFSAGGLQDIVLLPWEGAVRGGEKRSLLNQRIARRHA